MTASLGVVVRRLSISGALRASRVSVQGQRGNIHPVLALADVARFRADECEALVLASLACPLCLSTGTVEWVIDSDGYDSSARCRCGECAEDWQVYLSPWQALRLELLAARIA